MKDEWRKALTIDSQLFMPFIFHHLSFIITYFII